jgi:hypothetical protein
VQSAAVVHWVMPASVVAAPASGTGVGLGQVPGVGVWFIGTRPEIPSRGATTSLPASSLRASPPSLIPDVEALHAARVSARAVSAARWMSAAVRLRSA